MSWKEMNLWMRLPRHANIVPFDRVVVDELEDQVIGFTNNYVPGGTLDENKSRVFKLEWLQQLIKVVDDLNLRYGIAHRDIAPRNLVVDESTNSVMLFDFNFAARSRHPSPGPVESLVEDRNDVKCVVFTAYEIITRDDSLLSRPREEQNLEDLGQEWLKHPEVKSDHPVVSYQIMLQEWQKRRAGGTGTVHAGAVPEAVSWSSWPRPPIMTISSKDSYGRPFSRIEDNWFERQQDVRDRGGKVLSWTRPPQRLLDSGAQVLSTGDVISC